MTKINEYIELMVSELEEFRTDVNRLQEVNTKLKEYKISLDLKELKEIVEQHKLEVSTQQEEQTIHYAKLTALFQKASVYPRWAIITFMVMVLICCSSLFYTYTLKTNAIANEKAAYFKGEKSGTEYINLYLSENPKSLEHYKKWTESK